MKWWELFVVVFMMVCMVVCVLRTPAAQTVQMDCSIEQVESNGNIHLNCHRLAQDSSLVSEHLRVDVPTDLLWPSGQSSSGAPDAGAFGAVLNRHRELCVVDARQN